MSIIKKEQALKSNIKNFCETCGIHAIYNIQGKSWGRFCYDHKEITMVNVKFKTCEYPGCKTQPRYNIQGQTKRRFCYDHKETDMVDVKNKTCDHPGCKIQPIYNKEGQTKGKFCYNHKEIDMVNVKSKTCEYPGCKKRPSYNKEGQTKKRFCYNHKEIDMVNVENKTCEHPGCKTRPSYNKEGQTKGIFCAKHKEIDMVDVKSKTCEHPGCKTRPSYNKEGQTKRRFCANHKENDMIDVKSKTCEHPGCKIKPSYNKEGQTKRRFCINHKEADMVNVKIKTCEHPGCNTRSSYGYCGQKPSNCAEHKSDYMITKPNSRRCIGNDEEDCKELATYGEREPVHCEEHSKPNEHCWLVKPCCNCGRKNELLDKDGLCYFICSAEKYHSENKKYQKLKESIMIRYLRDQFKLSANVKECLADKIVDSMCNKYRPDIAYDCGTHIVIVECDENQHKSYNWQSCSSNKSLEDAEEKRMYEIFVAFGLMPTIFIRWNPDYFTINGKECKKYNQNKRLELLKKWLEYCVQIPPYDLQQSVKYIKLFYDDFEESSTKFKVIDL